MMVVITGGKYEKGLSAMVTGITKSMLGVMIYSKDNRIIQRTHIYQSSAEPYDADVDESDEGEPVFTGMVPRERTGRLPIGEVVAEVTDILYNGRERDRERDLLRFRSKHTSISVEEWDLVSARMRKMFEE
jgi:hypothetical protein